MIYFIGEKDLIENDIYKHSTVEECLNYFKDISIIQLDTETTGFDPHTCKLLTIQLGTFDRQYVIDVTSVSIKLFKELLESKEKLFLLQNAKFDLRFFRHVGIILNNIYDTFLAELILTTGIDSEERGLALDDLVLKYCGVQLDKSIRAKIHIEGLTTRVIKYAADDVKYLEKVRDKQLPQIQEYGLEKVLWLENEVIKVFAKMEYDGVYIDKDKWLEVAKKSEENVKICHDELDNLVMNEPKLSKFVPATIQGNLFGFEERLLDINWSSNAQKLKIVKSLGINIDSVGDRDLQKNKYKHPIIPKMIEYTKNAKLATAFGKKFLKFVNKQTNRVHCTIWPILNTGRISVSDPNLNQIPSKGELGKEIRSCFIPKPGCKIVGGDFSGMELRIIAEFSQDPIWIKAFNDNEDLHSVLCAATFDIDIKDVKKETPFKAGITYRDIQKTVSFGLAYGMSKFKLADTMQIEVSKADEIIKKFFSIVPKVQEFLDGLGNLGKKRGYIKTSQPFGRIRWFGEHKKALENKDNPNSFKIMGEIERASKNTPIQGTNGDIIKLALIRTQEEIDKNNWPVTILLAVYDEIQTECRSDLADKWKLKLDEIMVNAAKEVIKTVPVVVDCKISDCWQK